MEGKLSNTLANVTTILATGAILGSIINSSTSFSKGVVYENGEFDILKNCIDSNRFLIEKKLNEQIDCMKFEFNIKKVRELIDKIIQ